MNEPYLAISRYSASRTSDNNFFAMDRRPVLLLITMGTVIGKIRVPHRTSSYKKRGTVLSHPLEGIEVRESKGNELVTSERAPGGVTRFYKVSDT